MTVTFKDIKEKKNLLGQYMTPDILSESYVSNTQYSEDAVIIEPSFGSGSFLYKIEKKYPNNKVIGIEYDIDLFNMYKGSTDIFNLSFYKFNLENIDSLQVHFQGNPPYRTPALSLTSDDKQHVNYLKKKYNLGGIKEEAVYFIAHTVDLLETYNKTGTIEYLLPKTIFENMSPAFIKFRSFLKTYAPVSSIIDIIEDYPDVAQPLVYVKFNPGNRNIECLSSSLISEDVIPRQQIFKKTYLGSVPCESLFLSIKDEPLENFKTRLENIFIKDEDLDTNLKYNNNYHLRSLRGNKYNEKFKIIKTYVSEIKDMFTLSEFSDIENYKTIQHRSETRYYFRHHGLSKVSFIYIINSNPCKSFYFPGNPTKTSTDYFGYTEYDCNRNSSPGANRCVPIEGIENNITESFKIFWKSNTSEPLSEVFDYILHVKDSEWYKSYKAKYQRFYFSLPIEFDTTWKPISNIQGGKDYKECEIKTDELYNQDPPNADITAQDLHLRELGFEFS